MRCTTPSPAAGAQLGWGVAQTSRWGATSCSDKNGNVCGECQERGTGCLVDLSRDSIAATCSTIAHAADGAPTCQAQKAVGSLANLFAGQNYARCSTFAHSAGGKPTFRPGHHARDFRDARASEKRASCWHSLLIADAGTDVTSSFVVAAWPDMCRGPGVPCRSSGSRDVTSAFRRRTSGGASRA